jgi:hypothetical protein
LSTLTTKALKRILLRERVSTTDINDREELIRRVGVLVGNVGKELNLHPGMQEQLWTPPRQSCCPKTIMTKRAKAIKNNTKVDAFFPKRVSQGVTSIPKAMTDVTNKSPIKKGMTNDSN